MSSLPVRVQRALLLLLPPLAIAICFFVVIPKQRKLHQIEKEIQSTGVLQKQYLDKLEAIRDLPKDPRVATLPMTKEEQSNFLRGLAHLCAQSGNKIVSVSALAAAPPPPAPPPGQVAPPPAAGALPPDVVEIKSTIVFEGNFVGLRDFLAGLQRSRRLISMADIRIGAAQTGFPNVQTGLSVVRYVDNPVPQTAAPGAPSGGDQKTAQATPAGSAEASKQG
jgi:hypothetical protein